MAKAIIELLNGLLTVFERLFSVVNTTKKFLFFTVLILVGACIWLLYQASLTDEILSEFTTARIERVDTCYQQSVRLKRRIVAVQYPIPDSLVKLGATQVLSAVVIKDYPDIDRFNGLCEGLIQVVSDPENDLRWFQYNPELKKKLQDFYLNLDKPQPEILKKSDLKSEPNPIKSPQ
ncbi:MAG: hypothetical protein DI617_09235 [Streptococcus pyogenes]|nr:MAG: hypothetical protein DI617_09235 [Streptococcus pyogenes]